MTRLQHTTTKSKVLSLGDVTESRIITSNLNFDSRKSHARVPRPRAGQDYRPLERRMSRTPKLADCAMESARRLDNAPPNSQTQSYNPNLALLAAGVRRACQKLRLSSWRGDLVEIKSIDSRTSAGMWAEPIAQFTAPLEPAAQRRTAHQRAGRADVVVQAAASARVRCGECRRALGIQHRRQGCDERGYRRSRGCTGIRRHFSAHRKRSSSCPQPNAAKSCAVFR